MRLRGRQSAASHAIADIGVLVHVPAIVDLDRKRQTAFEIAIFREMLLRRFDGTFPDSFGDILVRAQVPLFIDVRPDDHPF